MSRHTTGLRIAALSLLLSGCTPGAHLDALPQWVRQPESVYASSQYLTAVGEGDTMRGAESHAMGRLAGRFETHVQSTQQLSDHVQETFGQERAYRKDSQFRSSTQLESDQTLLNAKTAEQFRDADGRCFVLVAVDRSETSRLYQKAIANNTQRIVALTKPEPSKLAAYAKAQKALSLGLNSRMLLNQLAVIHPASVDRLSLPYELDELHTRTAQTTGAIRFHATLRGDPTASLEQQIQKTMTEKGFAASPDCDLCISGTLSIQRMDFPRKDIHTVNYRALVSIQDRLGQTLLVIQEEGRESHLIEQEAYRRAQRTVNQLVDKALRKQLETFVDQLADGN